MATTTQWRAFPSFSRFARAGALLAAGALFAVTIGAGPHAGTVAGRCVEKETGAAVPKAQVWLEKDDTSSGNDAGSDAVSSNPDGGVPVGPLGDPHAPYGWSQGGADDADAGVSPGGAKLSTRADSQGSFTLAHIPAGQYKLHVSSSGTEDTETSVTVTDEDVTQVSVDLPRADPELSFSSTISTWTPAEDIQIGLRGQIRDHHVVMTLDRVDLPGVLARRPRMLIGPQGADTVAANSWPGEFTRVRQWSQEVAPRKRGYFYERLRLGLLPVGMYRLMVGNSETRGANWIVSTRLALVRKSYHDRALAYVSDIASGVPAAHVGVTLYEDGGEKPPTLRDRATTGADGLCRVSALGASAESRGILVARDGSSVAPVTMEMNSPGESGASAGGDAGEGDTGDGDSGGTAYSSGALRSFVYTERPIYRPGQTVYFKGIARWFVAPPRVGGADKHPSVGANTRPASGYRIPANQTVRVDIHDARDTLVSHQDLKTNDLGSWNGKVEIGGEALTGEYTIHADLGGQTSDTTFTVAAYRKPEYRVKITFDKPRYVRGDTIDATVTATYYHGAPVTSGSLDYRVYSNGGDAKADGLQSYRNPDGGDSSSSDSGEPASQGKVRLDDRGQAHIRVATKTGGVDEGDQTYNFSADVTDPSNNTVTAEETATVGQGEFSLTAAPSVYACAPHTPITMTLSASGPSDAPVAGQVLDVKTYYESWIDGKRRTKDERASRVTTDARGEAAMSLTPSNAGLLVTHVETRDKRGNVITAEASVWVAGEEDDVPAQYPDMGIVLDRARYKVGDTAHVMINTQHPGPSALVTIEGATLYHAWIVPLRRRSTALDIPVDAFYAPGVTVSVCCLLNKQMLSGSAPLLVDDSRRALRVSVTGDRALYRPGDAATLTVHTTDDAGRPLAGEVSVGVVDSSIYAIQEESATILNALQPDQGNQVNTDYSCAPLYLGDVDKGAIDGVKLRGKFPDTAYWEPDVRTDASGTATVHFTLPDNLTTWRVTCIGHTAATAVGKATCELLVSKDLLARLETPSFLIAGDRSTILAVVNNNTPSPAETQVTLNASGLQLSTPPRQTITVPAHGAASASWPVTAANIGPVTLKLTAVSQGLSDGVQQTLTVQPHAAQLATWQAGSIVRQISKTVTLDPKAIPDATVLRVRLAPTVSGALLPASEYLAAYPYGSADDTASILVGDSVLLAASNGAAPAFPMSTRRRADLTEGARRALLRLYRFQSDEGQWGWYPTSKADLNTTAYALWAMQLAQSAGVAVKASVLEAAVTGTAKLAQGWRAAPRDAAFLQSPSGLAFAALTLARAGQTDEARADIAMLQKRWRLRPETQTNADFAVAALALHRLGGADAAEASLMMADLWAGRTRLGQLTSWTYAPHPNSAGAAQNPPDALTTVWAMLAAQEITPSDPRLDAVARWLMANRGGDHWECPKTTAEAIGALTAYLASAHEMQPDFDTTLQVNGAFVKKLHFAPSSIDQPDQLVEISGASLHAGNNYVSLLKQGPGRLYYSLELRQQIAQPNPVPDPPFWRRVYNRVCRPELAVQQPAASGYRIKRVLLRTTSRRNFLWEDTVPTPDTLYRHDDTMLVRLIIDSTRAGSHLILEEPIPAGCAIAEVSGDQTESWNNWWDYTDVRDNKIVFFIGDLTRGRHEIDYHLRASAPGRYDVMPTLLTGTFDPTLRALGNASRMEVGE